MTVRFEATTIVAVKKGHQTAVAGDGQVTMGQTTIMKNTASKVRRLYNGQVLAGFAGSVADAFTLFDKFEEKLKEAGGNLVRAAVEMAKEWRSDRILKSLEAMLIVADKDQLLLLSGNGEIIEPDDGILAIGSGGSYALAAARALDRFSELSAVEIARESLLLASEICVFTNQHITLESIEK